MLPSAALKRMNHDSEFPLLSEQAGQQSGEDDTNLFVYS
jgi:hypothetical protein